MALTDALPAPAEDIPVRFDRDNPAKIIDLATAEQMLMDWRKRNPAQFGYWLAAAMTGAEPRKQARANSEPGR